METLQEVAVLGENAISFPIADEQIARYKDDYMGLHITGVDDVEGYRRVHEARMVVKRSRVEVEKTRKELVEESVQYQKRVNGEAKRIKALLEPIESHLQGQEDAYEAEKERIRVEKERQKQVQLQNRMKRMLALGMEISHDSEVWRLDTEHITMEDVRGLPDDEFESAMAIFEDIANQIAERKAEEERQRKALEERTKARFDRLSELGLTFHPASEMFYFRDFAAIRYSKLETLNDDDFNGYVEKIEDYIAKDNKRLADEAEAHRIEAERLKAEKEAQQAEAARLQAEREELQRQKAAIEAEQKRIQDDENARIAAEEQRKRDEQLKKQAAAEALRKAEEKRIADEKKAARKLALAPDREKLILLSNSLHLVPTYAYQSPEARQIADKFHESLRGLFEGLKQKAEQLS